jgi:hypothetical protein
MYMIVDSTHAPASTYLCSGESGNAGDPVLYGTLEEAQEVADGLRRSEMVLCFVVEVPGSDEKGGAA